MVLRFLKYFLPFQHLNDQQLIELANLIQIKEIPANETFIQLHSDSPEQYFLINGIVEVGDKTCTQWHVHSHSENSRNPLSRHRPSHYSVKSITDIKVVIVDLETVLQFSNKSAQIDSSEQIRDHYIYKQLLEDLRNNQLQLPSIPDIAVKILHSLNDEKSNLTHMARIISSDPAITTKIIKTANSPMYRSVKKIDNCKMAVSRLGTKITSQLVTSFSIKELFTSKNKLLKKRMVTLWEHSRKVAAISYNLAKITPGFCPEEALLAGLLHDIGAIPIIVYADNHPQIIDNEALFLTLIEECKAEVGAAILSNWKFSEELVTTAREAENWLRQPGEKPEYCDIIIVAQLHALQEESAAGNHPGLDEVPAYTKLALGQLTPELSISVLEQAEEQIKETIKLLT